MIVDRNDMWHWFPILKASGVPVPRTTFVTAPAGLRGILDGVLPEGYGTFVGELGAAARSFGFPVFLRTGHPSPKHSWRLTCHLERAEDIPAHVAALVEYSECADILGLPYRTWAVREFIPRLPRSKGRGLIETCRTRPGAPVPGSVSPDRKVGG